MKQAGEHFARASRFCFLERGYDPATGELRLEYGFEKGAPLKETITFPWAPWPDDVERQAAFAEAMALLHLIAGVSYYKAALPPEIDAGALSSGGHAIDARRAAFLESTWSKGLAEFAYVNGLDLSGHIQFPVNVPGDAPPSANALGLPDRALVAMGGGKDSLVSLEMLRSAGMEVQPVTVGASTLIGDTVRVAGLPLIRIERKIDERLVAMNQADAWNGHVPVTAINMAILTCAALLYGYRFVVFSNERSAEQATRTDGQGRPVNHQYSKSLEFEQAFRAQVAEAIAPDLEVFSLLRPLSEAAVSRRFAALPVYHPVFSSCNRNFHRDGSRIDGRWCGDCPKCRFTTLALAPWLGPDKITAIVGSDLLDDPAQEQGFRALCALGAEKPFECVGTVEESQALMATLAAHPAWQGHAVVRALAPELRDTVALPTLLEPEGPHCIPDEVLERVDL